MLLCVDVGNAHTTLGLLADGEVVDHWRVATQERRTADEWGLLVTGLLGRSAHLSDLGALAGVALCATVPSVLTQWRAMLTSWFPQVRAVVVEPGVRTGLPIQVDNPREVGADRIVNALAAATFYEGPTVVVDFGTFVTFDAVSGRGEYLGGAIAPGVDISLDALGHRGAQLRRVELAPPRSVVGRNTVEAMQSGILYGFAGQVDGVVARMTQALRSREPEGEAARVNVVATGTVAPPLLAACTCVSDHQPWLTLLGLELVHGRNG